jgi:hypothetical protein
MMLRKWPLIAISVGASLNCLVALGQQFPVDLTVRVKPLQQGESITIEEFDSGSPKEISFDPKLSAFVMTLIVEPVQISDAKTKTLWRKYVVTTSDATRAQTIYIRAGTGLPRKVDLEVLVPNVKNDFAALSAIDQIPSTDYRGLLRKYFESRAFHRQWAHNPTHEVAIRSAKIWFDAAYSLAIRQNSAFAMDPEAVAILEGYEAQAKSSGSLLNRLRRYVKDGYVKAMVDQLSVRDFEIVQLVPVLVRQNNLAEASRVNDYLLERLTGLDGALQATAIKTQRITPQMLESNKSYLDSLQRSRP